MATSRGEGVESSTTPGLQYFLAVTLARGGGDAMGDAEAAGEGWSGTAVSTSGLQCCLLETVARGGVDVEAVWAEADGGRGGLVAPIRGLLSGVVSRGEASGGVASPAREGDNVSISWSRISMLSWLLCCISGPVFGVHEGDGELIIPASDGVRISSSGSHIRTLSILGMANVSPTSWGLVVGLCCTGAIS